jgi:hypothetical protein
LSRPSERAGSGFEFFQTKPLPSLEESPLQVLNIDPEAGCLVQVPDKNQRIERAVLLPARFCIFRK